MEPGDSSTAGDGARSPAPRPAITPLTRLRKAARQDSSTSCKSVGSTRSVDSVRVTGVYPLGSLRVHDTDDAAPQASIVKDAQGEDHHHAELLQGGDVLIIDDLPAEFIVGCDAVSFTTKAEFLGFRDISPGVHLVWVASTESTSLRSAYWIHVSERKEAKPRIHVKQWDKFNEMLGEPASQAEERIQKERLPEIFKHLVSYDSLVEPPKATGATTKIQSDEMGESSSMPPLPTFLTSQTMWQHLTSAITPDLLNRVFGSSPDQGSTSWTVNTADRVLGESVLPEEASLYTTTLAVAPPVHNAPLHFTFPMDKTVFDPSAEGAERTRQALDPTAWILKTASRPSDLVGEMQTAFLTGAFLGNLACLEQWWHHVSKVVLRAHGLASEQPALARAIVVALHAQLACNYCLLEGDVLDLLVAAGRSNGTEGAGPRSLQRLLTRYRLRLDEALRSAKAEGGPGCDRLESLGTVGLALADLEQWVQHLEWDLRGDSYVRSGMVMLEDGEMVQAEVSDLEEEDERGEYAAVVVEVDEDGQQVDLVAV